MDFNYDLNLTQSQKILLTPQLKQALEILKMNSQELFEYMEEQLETNPVLEFVDNEVISDEGRFTVTTEQIDWENDSNAKRKLRERDDDSLDDIADFSADKPVERMNLKEYLNFQLHTSKLEEDQIAIGEYLIDNIDENGYLTVEINEVAAFFNVAADKISNVLESLQTFDPPGICARNLTECLLIQLRQMENIDKNVIRIVEGFLDDLGSNKISAVSKNTGLKVEEVVRIFNFIKTLEPKPGREYYNSDQIKFITPDIVVKKMKNKFEVLINEDSIPVLNISSYYKKIVSEDVSSDAKKFLQNKIENANWLIKCIEQRKSTLRKVAECIVEKQNDFFEKGKSYVKPLTMKTVAKLTDMHESTVSRTVSGKYLQCAWGIYEMKYFFSGKISASSGEEISAENLKIKLESIVKTEDKENPLSDNEIVLALKDEGVEISRRTVAKYRAELGIATAPKRKKY